MRFSYLGTLAIAACVAAVAGAPVQATEPDGTIDVNNPSCIDVAPICSLDIVHELEVTRVTTKRNSCNTEAGCTQDNSASGITYKVRWKVQEDGSVDVFDDSDPQAVIPGLLSLPGFQAVIGEGKTASNVWCGARMTSLQGVRAPEGNNITPTKLTFCWATQSPCLQSPAQVASACSQYPDTFDSAGNRLDHYLQARRVKPRQNPTNICGCSPAVAEFCNPSVAGSCPDGQFSAVDAEGVVTTGNNTCDIKVRSGGRTYWYDDVTFQRCNP